MKVVSVSASNQGRANREGVDNICWSFRLAGHDLTVRVTEVARKERNFWFSSIPALIALDLKMKTIKITINGKPQTNYISDEQIKQKEKLDDKDLKR